MLRPRQHVGPGDSIPARVCRVRPGGAHGETKGEPEMTDNMMMQPLDAAELEAIEGGLPIVGILFGVAAIIGALAKWFR